MQEKEVIVNNSLQKNYKYKLTEPTGKNFDPRFNPELTPKEMLQMGVFGGWYRTVTAGEFPDEWFLGAKLSNEGRIDSLNYFGLRASQPLSVWQKKGWINPQDPNGWFQWYCRYFMGRRSLDDERQIKRWIAMKRHVAQVRKYCKKGDLNCRKKQRQALLHWAYDSRKI